MLVVGIIAGKGVKTMKDYSIANRSFTNGIMMVTFLATIFGGTSTIGFAESVHEFGAIIIFADLGYILSYLFIAKYVANRMMQFAGMISVGDMMHKFYGENAQIITGILGFLFCAGIVAAQCKAIGYLLNATFGFSELNAIILGATVLVIYSTFGGIKSVTITDILQFAILIVMVPLISNIAVTKIGGVDELISRIPEAKLQVLEHERFWEFFVLFLYGAFPAFVLSPAPIQRLLMAKDIKIIKNMYYLSALMIVPFNLMVIFLGFTALILFPEVQSGLALPTVINELLPPVIKGLAIAGMLAIIMSTADSFLNTGAILLVHDIIRPVFKKHNISEFKAAKFATLFIGITAIYVAINSSSIIRLMFYAVALWGPIMVFPLAYGIFGIHSSTRAFMHAAALTVITFIIATFLLPADHKYWLSIICTAVNGLSFYIFTRRYASENREMETYDAPIVTKFNWTRKISDWLKFNIISYINKKVLRHGSSHMVFGIFCCLNYIVPYFMWTQGEPAHYEHMVTIRLISGIMCMALLAENYWPVSLKKYFGMYWYITLCVCLPFNTAVIGSLQGFDSEWLINMALAIFLLSLLVDWLSFIAIMIVGNIFSALYLNYFFPGISLNISPESLNLAVYIVIFSSLIGLIFSRNRDDFIDEKVNFLQGMSGMLAHEVRTPLAGVNAVNEIYENILNEAKVSESNGEVTLKIAADEYKMLQRIPGLLNDSLHKGHMFIDTFTSAIEAEVPEIDKNLISLKECLKEALENLKLSKKHLGKLHVKISSDYEFIGSKKYTMHVFLNILLNAIKHGGNDVEIWIKMDGSNISIKNNGKPIPTHILPVIFERTFSANNSSGLGLSFAKMVLNDLGGRIECQSDKLTIFKLAFN